ncbi:MAG: 4Fe-4S dicluster domain-containing protein [Candidatus Omnitrophica bacterium]|nr:4Fe-4S dicluster domain-containing protein [Candidatus Omnitrophota bacterium]
MARIRINKDRCKGCYLCIVNCPNSLIKIEDELNVKGVKPAVFSGGKSARLKSKSERSDGCTGCAMCALICPECIIEVYK